MTTHYGQYNDDERHALAARIWGHRLRAGQHWMEYMLEFLSVLSGFEYRLGQGLAGHQDEPGYQLEYRIPKRLGLRRFVFYDGREKTPDPRDQRATDEILRRLQARLMDDARQSDDILGRLRSLLRSFSAIEDNRSWYAKNLFPVHEEFLLWEALRKGSTLRRYVGDVSSYQPADMDRGIEFYARNFFARGGELYYLLISAGTEGNLERRRRIAGPLHSLLTERNQVLGEFARLINGAWDELVAEDGDTAITGRVGWIPDPHCRLYQLFAEDLDVFLDNQLDSLECLELLAHLISFHIVCYIYHRAHPASDAEGHASGSCLDACRPHMLVDLLGDEDGGMIREKSAGLLRKHDAWQNERARECVLEQVRCWAEDQPDDTQLIDTLTSAAEQNFGRARKQFNKRLGERAGRYGSQAVSREALIQEIGDAIFALLSSDFHTHFAAVHGRLGRAIGLIAPRKGPRQRFVLGDTLLKTLVLANVRAGETLAFGALLERLYERYGIVVGPGEARDAGLIERLRINEEHFTRNREALLSRMKRAGLVTQYSDATALVRRT